MYRTFALMVSGVCLLTAAPAMASKNLIKNGGFEQPIVPTGSYELFSEGQAFHGWNVVGAPGTVAPISGAYTQDGLRFGAKAGKQWLDLTGLSNSATGVAQRVKTASGRKYRLSFSVGNVVDPGGIFGVRSTVDVLVGGHRIMVATNSNGGGKTYQVWKEFTKTFKATSSITKIEFLNGDPVTDNSNGLDAVTLTTLG